MKNDGEPAFPGYDLMNLKPGLTKREYFAGQAMIGILSRENGPAPDWKRCGEDAVKAADALLAELAKEQS